MPAGRRGSSNRKFSTMADKDLIFGTNLEAKYNLALQKIGIEIAMLSNEAGHA